MKCIYIPFPQNNEGELFSHVKVWQSTSKDIVKDILGDNGTITLNKALEKYPRILLDNLPKQGLDLDQKIHRRVNDTAGSACNEEAAPKYLKDIKEADILYIFAHGIFQLQKIASSLQASRTVMTVVDLYDKVGKSIIDQKIKTIKIFACNSGLTKSDMPDIRQGDIAEKEFSDLSFARYFSYLLQHDITVMGYTRPLGTNGPESITFPHKKTGSNETRNLMEGKEKNRPSIHRVQFKNGIYIGNTRTLSTTGTTESTQNDDVKVIKCTIEEYKPNAIFTEKLGYTS